MYGSCFFVFEFEDAILILKSIVLNTSGTELESSATVVTQYKQLGANYHQSREIMMVLEIDNVLFTDASLSIDGKVCNDFKIYNDSLIYENCEIRISNKEEIELNKINIIDYRY
jgi:hypothetical protein